MKLGKLAPVVDPRVPLLSHRCMLVQPLPAVDWTKAVTSWPMLDNDKIGSCTAAAALHLIQCWLSNSRASDWEPENAEAIALYSATGGYPAQDEGAVETTVLKYWQKNGLATPAGVDTIAFATLNPQNIDELKLSIQWFGGAYIGVALPISAQTQDVWDVAPGGATGVGAPNSWGGHAICLVAYDETTFTCVTWGRLVKMTHAFAQAYIDEAYAVLSRDWLDVAGISPPGLSWPQLEADMKAIQD